MKKILSLTGIMVLAAIVSTSASAGTSGTGNSATAVDQQAVHHKTDALRSSLAADQAELDALMAGNNPDPKQARALSESIGKAENELSRQSRNYMVSMMNNGGHMGRSYGHNGQGYHMMGGMNGYMAGCM